MSRLRGSHRAWWMVALAWFAGAGSVSWPAAAQAQVLYETALHALDLAPDPLERSPRLLGMGRLTLVNDVHNRLTLWDFGQNPTGILDADSTSTMELRPATSARSGTFSDRTGGLREYVASRGFQVGYEAWNRAAGSNAFGIYGDLSALRHDRPFNDDLAITGSYQVPTVIGIINGRMPYLFTDRAKFALRFVYRYESDEDQYRTLFSNSTGQYLSEQGVLVAPPNFFDPDEITASTLGGGAGMSYDFGPWLVAAVNLEGTSTHIEGNNEEARYFTGTGEDRPYITGQTTLAGRGTNLEYALDGHLWRSDSEADWVHTLAGGIGQQPFSGRGNLYTRGEEGSSLRARARWLMEALELGASLRTFYRQTEIDAPPPEDHTSFNYFRNTATYRTGLDSLALPDSISDRTSDEREWELVGGASYRLPGRNGLVGAEYHMVRQRLDQTTSGAGPERRVWDMRVGYERACTPVMDGRLGYIYRADDRDHFTRDNELTSHTLTAGIGLRQSGGWSLDVGYAFEWLDADYGTPASPKETRQQASAQIRWLF